MTYRQELGEVYFDTHALIKLLNVGIPRQGGIVRIAEIAQRLHLHGAFPPWLSVEGQERVVRRTLELGYVQTKGIAIPAWIGLSVETEALSSPPHPHAPTVYSTIIVPPR